MSRPRFLSLEVAVFAFLTLWGAAWWVMATAWPLPARTFPLVIAVPFTIVAASQVVVALVRSRRPRSDPAQPKPAVAQPSDDLVPSLIPGAAPPPSVAAFVEPVAEMDLREVCRLVVALIGFAASIILFGFVLGLAIGVFVYCLREAKAGWPLSLALAVASFAYLYLLSEVVLNVPVPKPLLQQLVETVIGRG